ncbi:MAG: hypothetical protein ACK4SJ_11265 [Sphingorhabdus sp.]
MHESDPGTLITAMIAELREQRPGIHIERKIRPIAAGWRAEVAAGFPNGAFPLWVAEHPERALAMLKAVEHAHSYWLKVSHAS